MNVDVAVVQIGGIHDLINLKSLICENDRPINSTVLESLQNVWSVVLSIAIGIYFTSFMMMLVMLVVLM